MSLSGADLQRFHDTQRAEIRKKRCSECDKRIKPTYKVTHDPMDWFFLDCDTCLESFCKDCCFVDDTTGVVTCYTCYESSLHSKKETQS